MDKKDLVRDAGLPSAGVWTGSTNLPDDSWTLQENNTLVLRSRQLAGYYARDFADLWRAEQIEDTGDFDTTPATLRYRRAHATLHVHSSPGPRPATNSAVPPPGPPPTRPVRVRPILPH